MYSQRTPFSYISLLLTLLSILTLSVSSFYLSTAATMKQSKTAVIPARTLAYPQRQTALENIATVATGGVYSCAVTTTGSVYCWGWNGYGQLGDGTTLNRARPVAVSQLAGSVKAVSTGADHTCAILISGMMQCWGINWGGQLGNGTTENTALPITVSGLSDVTAISVGSDHTCALVRSSGLYCWGRNDYGQLGDGTTTSRLLPTGVSGLSSGVSAISAGRDHTCAILTSGTAHCWGRNSTGQLGDGTTVNQSAPVAVSNLGNGISQISAGGEHTCAHLTDGRMLCWGDNSSGQLGNGSTINQSTPGVVSGLPGSVNLISSGEYYTCALLNVGSLHCWGNNYYGQLGEGTTVGSEIPMTVAGLSRDISQISAGRNHTCAVLLTGNLRCWGQHKGGQVGDGLYSPLNTAVVGLGSGVKSVSVAEDRTCVLLIVGEIQCWGSDAKQQDFGDRRTQIPTAVSGVSDTVSAVSVSMTHTCLLLINGGVQCWGRNTSGQLGDGTSQDRVTPSPVSGLASGVKAISTGATHSCALLESGSVRCWGGNSRGQLGDGTIQNQTTPVSVSNLGNIVSQIGAGGEYTCVLLNTGGVQCWGHNALGQLGDGTTNSKTTPVAVSGLSNGVHQLSVGIDHACALLNSGSVVCWGNNIYGQLGDGTDANKTTPVAVYNLRDVRQISAGQYHTCAITGDGGAHCWGFNFDSQLGEGTTDNSAIPVAVLELGSAANPVTLVSAGGYHTCALLASTGLRCWGDNVSGQLGNANAWRTTPVDVVEPATQSPTPTPSPTITQSPTPTVTATPTLSPTLTTTPPVSSDDEPNNTCAQAKSISTDGVAQEHSFSIAGDEDWVRFDAMPNLAYRIEVQIPDSSPADVILEFYRNCAGQPTTWNKAFTPGVRLDVTTTVNAPLYFKFSNLRAEVAGPQVTYRLSVRTLTRPQSGAIILVAGRLKLSDTLQSNILQVTDQVYDLFTQRGYAGENIYYLAPDLTRPGRDALASRANLRAAITQWAKERVSSERTLTLYLIDHGEKDRFFIDETKQERLTSDDLNGWLNELEQGIPGLKVNVIIDACYSGSFISGDQRIGKAGRVIITSTSDEDLAFASATGAYFSDHFLTALRQDNHLLNSFLQAESAVRQIELAQQPWLDGDGDGIANEAEDRAVAAQRGFGYGQGALGGDGDLPWPPYIASAAPISVTNQHAVIQAEVRDDQTVRRVWAVIYPPSYTPPQNSQELAPETLPTIVLQPKGNGQYAAEFTGFDQTGVYRIAIHAEDDENLEARPLLIEVSTGRSVFLPLVVR